MIDIVRNEYEIIRQKYYVDYKTMTHF